MGGYLFLGHRKMKYNKPPTSFSQQVDILESRGMSIPDKNLASHYLSHINYYRLSEYWLPFESNHGDHTFHPGTTFEQVLAIYILDRELRLLVMDAIERIEISVRTQWAYHFSHRYGPHAYLDSNLFKTKWNHQANLGKLKYEVAASQETFIQHLRNKYDETLPPIWAVVEIMTLRQLSKWFANLTHGKDRNTVAHVYDMDEINLTSYLHHLSTVRNVCAHHSRLWNREFTFTYKLPTKRPQIIVNSLNRNQPRKLYNTLVMLEYLMEKISPGTHWKQRLFELLKKHPVVNPATMGFPENWQALSIWN